MQTNGDQQNGVKRTSREREQVAIIGAGVSGLAAGNIWRQFGYEVTIFEASDSVGGQWNTTYPGVRLQNTAPQYQFADFPWPFSPDRHPTGEQIRRYMHAAADAFDVHLCLKHEVTRLEETEGGWKIEVNGQPRNETFAYVIIATGQYPGGAKKWLPPFPGIEKFQGKVLTNIDSQAVFDDRRVVVIGFGKTALDYAAWSAPRAKRTTHVFRTPRWTIPDYLLGICFTRPFFARFGSDMMTSWVYSSAPQKFLHRYQAGVVKAFWWFIATLFAFQHRRNAKLNGRPRSVLDTVIPPKSQFVSDLRSATALAPDDYYYHVAHQGIDAKRDSIAAFDEQGVILSGGERIEADVVCVCVGNEAPSYPYLPERYRSLLEQQAGGPALYRHLIHPEIPRLGFAGYNHGFLHIALCEVGALWSAAALRGDLELPSVAEMKASAERVSRWKQEHSAYESTFNLAVNTRYQQYIDILLQDLGLSQWRKLPNIPAEIFLRYDPTDYRGIVPEFQRLRKRRPAAPVVQPVDA